MIKGRKIIVKSWQRSVILRFPLKQEKAIHKVQQKSQLESQLHPLDEAKQHNLINKIDQQFFSRFLENIEPHSEHHLSLLIKLVLILPTLIEACLIYQKARVDAFNVLCFPLLILIEAYPLYGTSPVLVKSSILKTDGISSCCAPMTKLWSNSFTLYSICINKGSWRLAGARPSGLLALSSLETNTKPFANFKHVIDKWLGKHTIYVFLS